MSVNRRSRLAYLALVAAAALLAGLQWASGVRGEDPYEDSAKPMTWQGHSPIFGSNGDRVGWIAQGGDGLIEVPLPATFTSDPLNPVAVGVNIVYSDGGQPIGIFGPWGFERGALRNGTELDPCRPPA